MATSRAVSCDWTGSGSADTTNMAAAHVRDGGHVAGGGSDVTMRGGFTGLDRLTSRGFFKLRKLDAVLISVSH